MAVKRGGLGRGLDSLIPNRNSSAKTEQKEEEKKIDSKLSGETKKKNKTGKSTKSSKKSEAVSSPAAAEEPAVPAEQEKLDKPASKSVKKTSTRTGTRKSAVKAEKPAAKTAEKPAAKAEKPAAKTAEKPAVKAEKPASKAAAKPAPKNEEIPAAKPAETQVSEPAEDAAPAETAQKEEKMPVKTATAAPSDSVVMMKISQVEPNRNQPRKEFDKEKLEELAESIRQYGVIQPLLVQKSDGYYEIIAGERRWRASQMAGIREVPVIIRDYSEQEVVEISLIENIQREDLNPIEEANAYVRLMDEFHMTQEAISQRVSKSRAAVTNAIRLLRLPQEIREMLIYGELTEGHARALLGIPDPEAQIKAARTVIQNGASVRETEKLVKEILHPTVRPKRERNVQNDVIFRDLEEQMKRVLGTKVSIRQKNKNAGKIEIDYYSGAELERLLDLIRSITS